jgi:hypothetical protein
MPLTILAAILDFSHLIGSDKKLSSTNYVLAKYLAKYKPKAEKNLQKYSILIEFSSKNRFVSHFE